MIILTGGEIQDEGQESSATYCLDLLEDKWSEMPSLNFARLMHSSIQVAANFYVIGGYSWTKNKSVDHIEYIDIESKGLW